MPRKKAPSERAYARLTRHERQAIERMLDRGKGCREIAWGLGRAPSTVANEVGRRRFVTSPRALRGEPAPAAEELAAACPRLASWPRCCDGCSKRRGHGCNRKPRVFYNAGMAQRAADAELSESRRGIDETEAGAAAKLDAIRDGLRRGLSPEQIATTRPDLGLSGSTIYRWVDAGYAGMTNMELRRKVGYRPRRKSAPAGAGRHSARWSHAAFEALPEDGRAGAWEMDTVEGRRGDSARLLTLHHGPTGFQLAIPVPDGACASVLAGLGLVRAAPGEAGMRRVFRLVLTDNGAEFADEGAIAALLGELPGETRLYYCGPRRADQKGGCERNHVEIRKLLPKGRGISFDRLARRRGARDVACQLRASRQARVADARRDAPRRARGGRARPHGRLRGRDAGARGARPDARARGARPSREGRGAAGRVALRGQPDSMREPVALSPEAARSGPAEHALRTHRDAPSRILHQRERRREAPCGASRPSR